MRFIQVLRLNQVFLSTMVPALVIGGTAIVEKGVLLYHGWALGGTGKDIGKRHPTVRKGSDFGPCSGHWSY